MTDLEISKAIALAIGWKPEQIIEYEGQDYIGLPVVILRPAIKLFSYRFWNVIGPIAEKFDCFPSIGYPNSDTPWESLSVHNYELVRADTPQKAIALAVIKQGEKQ